MLYLYDLLLRKFRLAYLTRFKPTTNEPSIRVSQAELPATLDLHKKTALLLE